VVIWSKDAEVDLIVRQDHYGTVLQVNHNLALMFDSVPGQLL
jgi:hypothetical protein